MSRKDWARGERPWAAYVIFAAVAGAMPGLADGAGQNLLPGAIHPGAIHVSLQTMATGLVAPVSGVTQPGDTSDLFVVDQAGKVEVMHNGVMQATPFLDLTGLENAVPLQPGYDERGLLSLAFDPGFNNPASPGFHMFYTYQSEAAGTATADYGPAPGTLTLPIDHQNVVSSWKVNNAGAVDMASRVDLIREDHPALNHNGGTIAFGPDGMLYWALGDGGNANDVGSGHIAGTGNAQSLSVIMGKMLRIDPHGNNSANGKYGIPADNPFVNTTGAAPEIYAYGLRNPYKFSFDPASGKLIEGDVGQNEVEEVNVITKGANYGWGVKEGTFLFDKSTGLDNPVNSPGSPAGLTDPIMEYDHNSGTAINGGFVYHGSLLPQLDGMYIFGDFSNGPFNAAGNGRLFYADLSTGVINEFNMDAPLGLWLKGFGEDANGEIFVMASTNLGPRGTTGVVFELVPEPETLGVMAAGAIGLLRRRRSS